MKLFYKIFNRNNRNKNLFSLFLFCCIIFNYSAKATGNGDIFYFDFNTNLRSSEIINAPVSESPTASVTIYFPRTDLYSGKNKSFLKRSKKYLNLILKNSFFVFVISPPLVNFETPIYLMIKVFLI